MTVGELRELLRDVVDDTPVVAATNPGHLIAIGYPMFVEIGWYSPDGAACGRRVFSRGKVNPPERTGQRVVAIWNADEFDAFRDEEARRKKV